MAQSIDKSEPDLSLRPYQMRLVELCRQTNSIIWLGTGMGKTYVAVELIKDHLELANAPIPEGGKRVIFLAPTVPLARQQSSVITRFTGVSVRRCCGVDGVDLWDLKKWSEIFNDNAVLVMTPAVFRDCLQKLFIKMEQISLIIFDECHHSVGDSMYAQIMKNYQPGPQSPRLLAMTATLVNSKIELAEFDSDFKKKMCDRIQKHLDHLSSTLHCTIQTTEDPKEYNSLGANPKIDYRYFLEFPFQEIIAEVEKHKRTLSALLDVDKSKVFQLFDKTLRFCKTAVVDLGPVGAINILKEFRRGQQSRLENPSFEQNQTHMCVQQCQELEDFIARQQRELNCEISSKVQALVDTLVEFHNIFSGKLRKDDSNSDLNSLISDSDTSNNDQQDDFLDFWQQIMKDDDEEFEQQPVENGDEISAKIAAKIAELNEPAVIPATIGGSTSALNLEEAELRRVATCSGLCCVVFVEQRLICAALAQILDATSRDPDSELYNCLNVDYVIGQSGSGGYGEAYRNDSALQKLSSLSARMTDKRQEAVLAKFRIGLLNVVVATNVLEEGLDVPQCNLIVMFDMPKTPKDFIQSKGRGRAKGACYVVLMPELERAEMERTFKFFRLTEKLMMLKYFGFVENLDMNAYTSSEKRDQLIPPFCPNGPNGQRLDRLRAVELLNQYVAKLGRPGGLVVDWQQIQVNEVERIVVYNFKATLQLPNDFGITESISHENWMPTKRLANQAVALEACKILFEKGLIRLDSIPTSAENAQAIADKESILIKPSVKGAGTNKHCDFIDRPIPRFLNSTTSRDQTILYKIKLDFENVVTKDTKRLLDMISQSGSSFGLISPGFKLPNLPKFRLYPRKHEVLAEFQEIGPITLTLDLSENLQRFHQFLFEKIIFRLIEKDDKNFEFSPNGIGSILPFLVVPLEKSNSIDWKSVQLVASGDFDEKLYPNSIFPDQTCLPTLELAEKTPANSKSLIAVIKVCENETASSIKFPDQISHFQLLNKRGVKVSDPNQRLVYGVPLTTRLDHFWRLQLKSTGNSATRNVGCQFVPETLIRLPISGSFTALSRYLPSLIYRIYQLWLVQDFRNALCNEIGLKIEQESDQIIIGDKGTSSDLFAVVENEAKNDEILKLCQDEFNGLKMANKDPFEDLPGELVQISNHQLADSIRGDTDGFHCKSCHYFVNVHLPGVFRTYFLVKMSEIGGGKIAFKCRLCCRINLDQATPFDLLKHVVQTHPRLLSSPYVVWPDFTNISCRICRLVFVLMEQNDDVDFEQKPQIRCCSGDNCKQGDICRKIHHQSGDIGPPIEICRQVVTAPSLTAFFQALLSIRARDIFDNERFELLGDTFLKFAVTTYLFVKYQNCHQGQVTFVKSRLVSNANLRNWAEKWQCVPLMGYPFLTPFNPQDVWLPPCYVDLSENLVRRRQKVSDKAVADTVESLIGLFLTTCGPDVALRFLNSFGIKFTEIPTDFDNWADLIKVDDTNPQWIQAQWHHFRLEEVEARLGYHFKHRQLLLQAFCHPSAASGQAQSYERVELLGDALIDYLVTACLFTKTAKFQPGILSTVRMAVVNNDILGSLCVVNNFHTHINASPAVLASIGAFVNDFFAASGNKPNETRIQTCPYRNCGEWAEAIEVPKVLGDIFEALAGAVFVDSGLNFNTFWAVFFPLLESFIERFAELKPCNPVRELHERFALGGITFRYGPPPPTFRLPPLQNSTGYGEIVSVYVAGDNNKMPAGTGRGANKKLAKQAAANMALANLNQILPQLRWRLRSSE